MLGDTRLIFLKNDKGQPSTGSALDHLGFSFADLDAKMKEFEAAGIKVVTPVRDVPGLFKLGFIEDPWGTRIEVVQDTEKLGLHHVHLRGPDPAATLAFYKDKFARRQREAQGSARRAEAERRVAARAARRRRAERRARHRSHRFSHDQSRRQDRRAQGAVGEVHDRAAAAQARQRRHRQLRRTSKGRRARRSSSSSDDQRAAGHPAGSSRNDRSSSAVDPHPSSLSVRSRSARRMSIARVTPGPPPAPRP